MNELLPNIRKDLAKLIPVSVLNEITCFSFYDNHPLGTFTIDVVLCTIRGEIQEIYERETISSYFIENARLLSEIKLIRNNKCKLYYIVKTEEDLLIFSRNEKISLLHRINNIDRYDIDDPECKGQAHLKIVRKDDAVPLIFDANNEKLEEGMITSTDLNTNDSVPLLLSLKRKLTEAHYCVQFNKTKYLECLNLCQEAVFHMYEKSCTNSGNSKFQLNISNLLKIKTKHPQMRLCNKKILIILNIENQNNFSIENVSVSVHSNEKQSICYKTKMFQEIPESPYWIEIMAQKVNANQEMSIVAVIDLDELQTCISSRMELDVILSYDKDEKSYLLPFEKVIISAMDLMGKEFDVLSSENYDSRNVMLCILSTSEKTQLCIRHLNNPSENNIMPSEIFCEYLKMDMLSNLKDIAIHKLSPYHILYGVMVVFLPIAGHTINVMVYSRISSQVLALVKYINDVVPYRLIITTNNYKIISLDKTLSKFDEVTEDNDSIDNMSKSNLISLGKSVLKQTSLIKEYLDNCLMKMSECKNVEIQEKLGSQIDLVSQGLLKYLEFRENIIKEETKSINEDVECMVIDS